jgi:hypothetical protein
VDGGKSGSSMMSKSQQKKMKNKIKTAVMQALEAEAKSAGASGDDAKEEGKKKLSQMIASAAEDQQWDTYAHRCGPGSQRGGAEARLRGAWKSVIRRPNGSRGRL